MEELDCRGQQCPQPVVKTRRMMLAQPASLLKILVDDIAARDNVSRLAKTLGYAVSIDQTGQVFELKLVPGEASEQRVPAAGMVPETPFCGAFLLTA